MPRKVKASGNHGGMPRKVITTKEWGSIDYMCMIHCTGEEIAGILQIDYDTLNRNSMEKWGIPISEYIKKKSFSGKMSLRRAQWKAAENGNTTMLIWLGKQWLDQKEKIEQTGDDSSMEVIEEITKEIRKAKRNERLKQAGSDKISS